MNPYLCPQCHFEIFIPLWETEVSVLGLYDDSRFPGRGILALRDHADHLDEVPSDIGGEFLADGATVGRALRRSGLAVRVNYSVLGNEHPHVHMHVIPRGGTPRDTQPSRPIWERADRATPLDVEERQAVIKTLLDHLRT